MVLVAFNLRKVWLILPLLMMVVVTSSAIAASRLQEKVDSLFVLASSGEVAYRDLVEPAKDSIAALGVEVVPHLIEKFDTKSARERHTILHILKRIGSPAVPYLIRSLDHPNGLIVQRVCWALGDIADSSAVSALVAVSSHNRWQVRDEAIGALGDIGNPGGSPAIISGLSDSIGQVRKAAAVSAGKVGVIESVDRLVEMLGDGFYGARLSAVNSLLAMDSSVVLAAIRNRLKPSPATGDDLVGDLGCRVLGRIGSDSALSILFEQTGSDSPDRRAHAAMALAYSDPSDNCGYLKIVLDRETDRFVRLKIESALAAARPQD
jgi:HEAT repeat protein